jgi:hypothetical protein
VTSSSLSFILLEVTGEILRRFTTLRLGALITTGEKNGQHRTPLLKIGSVIWVRVDLQLEDSCPNGTNIAGIAADDALNLGLNERLSSKVPKASEPTRRLFCTANRKPNEILALRLRAGKGSARHFQSGGTILRSLAISWPHAPFENQVISSVSAQVHGDAVLLG